MTIEQWISHWQEKLDELVAARTAWAADTRGEGSVVVLKQVELDRQIEHHERLIRGLKLKQQNPMAVI